MSPKLVTASGGRFVDAVLDAAPVFSVDVNLLLALRVRVLADSRRLLQHLCEIRVLTFGQPVYRRLIETISGRADLGGESLRARSRRSVATLSVSAPRLHRDDQRRTAFLRTHHDGLTRLLEPLLVRDDGVTPRERSTE